jgi:hypothetical protein
VSPIPASQIGLLSSGEVVGVVADDPRENIRLKAFHAEIVHDAQKLNKEVSQYQGIPAVMEVNQEQVNDNTIR